MSQQVPEFSWELQEFDTQIFNFPVAKILHISQPDSETVLAERVKKLTDDLRISGVQYATYRIAAFEFFLIHVLERAGFILVDGFINLEKTLSGAKKSKENPQIKIAQGEKSGVIEAMGSKIFSYNRLYNDPFIQKEKADLFYTRWVQNCLFGKAADLVLVWEEKEKIVGFVALQKSGHIPLIGVKKEWRGKGIAKGLINESLRYFLNWRVKKIRIGTQVTNISAIRAYSSCGFQVIGSELSFAWHA